MTNWAEGTRLGPYALVSPIGRGGMGEVWKARDTRLERTVAIKRLRGEYSERFQKEARAIAALNHPNICQLYDVGPDYLVMEFIDGRTVEGPKSEAEGVRIALQIVSALEEAHRRGVIHRDLKPGNIMVTETGLAKLLDFGIAKVVASWDAAATVTIDGTVMGTAGYMAPEQAEGKLLDERSDIFSLGAVLYEMLSGKRAFDGDSTAEVISALLRDTPPPLSCHPDLERIVMRCLVKQPGRRFQTVSEVRAAIEQFATASSGSAGRAPVETEPSIAVLPFANMSADKENEYFSDGLAEEIINALAHIPGLMVTARTSAFAFRDKEQDIRKIADALGVRTVLEGSVRRAGNRIRVTAQLINAADGYHLWSERYDRELADVFAMQDEIAQSIASALKVKLSGKASSGHKQRHTPAVAAFEALLKARHYGALFTPESFRKAKDYFEQAIALDPQFALAHVELGLHFCLTAIATILPARQAMPLVRAQAQRALEIDPDLPEAQAMLGVVAALFDYDWLEAKRRFQLAMAHESLPWFVRFAYAAWYLTFVGRYDEAVSEFRGALQADPLNAPALVAFANTLIL
jgi:eukaryotic-like serine/threonine-protein kinase